MPTSTVKKSLQEEIQDGKKEENGSGVFGTETSHSPNNLRIQAHNIDTIS